MHIQNKSVQDGLVVVSGREHGKIYTLKEGSLTLLEHVEEHPPTYSDNEGFFVRSGEGERYGSGNPQEEDDQRNLERYVKAITEELSDIVKREEPASIYIIEPEHLKGQIEEHLVNPTHIPLHTVTHGNFVDNPLSDLIEQLEKYGDDELDPADPASVEGEENAEEKRKILETAQLRQS